MSIPERLAQLEAQPALDLEAIPSLAEDIRCLPDEADREEHMARLEAEIQRRRAAGDEADRRRDYEGGEYAISEPDFIATMNRRHVADVRRVLHRPPQRRRMARARGAGRPAGRPRGRSRCRRGASRRSSAASGDPGDTGDGPGEGDEGRAGR